MKMHFLSGGRLTMRKSIYFPDADCNETLELPVICALLRHPEGNVLFDTGFHPDIDIDPEARWGALTGIMTPSMSPGDDILNGLKSIGLRPDDINVVICSDFHSDHCGCNQFFHGARFLAREEEFVAAMAQDARSRGYIADDWDHSLPYESVRRDLDLFGDGAIRLVHLPGNTPGTMGAVVTLANSGRFLLASGAVGLRSNLDTNIVPTNSWNKERCRQSFERIRQLEAQGATVICGHDDEQWSSLRKGADCYD